jgi:hypothetical protein
MEHFLLIFGSVVVVAGLNQCSANVFFIKFMKNLLFRGSKTIN